MEQNIGYIKSIKITGLWGKQDILWNLRPDANILSGIKVLYYELFIKLCILID